MRIACTVVLRGGREKPVIAGHPWVFSGAVREIRGERERGGLCTIVDEGGRFLAKGYLNPDSRIIVRVLTREQVDIDGSFFSRSLRDALDLRERTLGATCTTHSRCAFRVVNAEGDWLPGLVVDRYAGGLVIQAQTAGMQKLKGLIVDALLELFAPSFIFEKTDPQSASLEGLTLEEGCLHGQVPARVGIEEEGARFLVDIAGGQKTGFYLDQRENRAMVKGIASGADVLNCFSYTGAFGIQALRGGARLVRNVDASRNALEVARENMIENGYDEGRFSLACGDVFSFLRGDRSEYDIVILDPPKFAGSVGELGGAARGYKDINLKALGIVKPGGYLATFSCSGVVSEDLFQKIVFGAVKDAGRRVQIVRRLRAGCDHPVNLAHREGEYLKGLLLRVT